MVTGIDEPEFQNAKNRIYKFWKIQINMYIHIDFKNSCAKFQEKKCDVCCLHKKEDNGLSMMQICTISLGILLSLRNLHTFESKFQTWHARTVYVLYIHGFFLYFLFTEFTTHPGSRIPTF
jgi:hypothetical protein